MSKEYKEAYDKILNILYPGYSDMSPKRKDAIEFRAMGVTAYATQIDEIFDKMKDSESSLYQEGASDKDIVNIAAIYARIHEESSQPNRVQTEKIQRGGEFWDEPIPEYGYKEKTDAEIKDSIEAAVKKYNSQPRISLNNIINGIKKYKIDYTTALNISSILKEMQTNKAIENKNVEMEK